MQNLFRSLKNVSLFPARRTRSLRMQGVDSLESFQPLYDRKPPWWTRWTYFLVGADLIVTASACELTWNHWTRWEPLADDAEAQTAPSSPAHTGQAGTQEGDAKEEKGHYVLRPWWQRAPFAGGQVFLGVALAALILGSRSRIIRRLYILPPTSALSPSLAVQTSRAATRPEMPSEDHRVVIQCVDHFRNQGRVLPMRACSLERGKDESELIVWIENVRGHYWFGMDNATVFGRQMPVWQVRDEVFKAWYGEEKGKKMSMQERWKSGPVLKST